MNDIDRIWPPLIVKGRTTRAIVVRDLILTSLMWFLFLLMVFGEFGSVMRPVLDRLGASGYFHHVGLEGISLQRDWRLLWQEVSPFLLISLCLIISLLVLSLETLVNRRYSDRHLPTLDIAQEALQIDTVTLEGAGRVLEGENVVLLPLAVFEQDNEQALVRARDSRVAAVHVTPQGRYQIRFPQ